MKSLQRILFAGIVFSILAACSQRIILASDHWAVKAKEVPDHFMVGRTNGFSMTAPEADGDCRSPMIDPRDSTKITLFRSFEGRGDYEVPKDMYGVEKGHILRLDCVTGRVIGIFKK
ncbi:MAG: hypothetical protein IPL46_10835 [Saprospiraceae bacterium]|nr:hypothetical protein [Saprospiraceae bacterium]